METEEEREIIKRLWNIKDQIEENTKQLEKIINIEERDKVVKELEYQNLVNLEQYFKGYLNTVEYKVEICGIMEGNRLSISTIDKHGFTEPIEQLILMNCYSIEGLDKEDEIEFYSWFEKEGLGNLDIGSITTVYLEDFKRGTVQNERKQINKMLNLIL